MRPGARGARGIYGVVSTFFLVLLALVVVLVLVGLAHLMAAAQARIDDRISEQNEFLTIRDRLLACAGNIFDPADAVRPCYNFSGTRAAAVMVRQLAFRTCPNATFILYNASEPLRPLKSQVFAYPTFNDATHLACPGEMLLYI